MKTKKYPSIDIIYNQHRCGHVQKMYIAGVYRYVATVYLDFGTITETFNSHDTAKEFVIWKHTIYMSGGRHA